MAVTKSGQNNLTSPDGNGLALFVDINDGGLKMKDINGNIENVSSYVYSRPLDAGVLMMDNGIALSSTIALIQDQNNNNSRLYLATNQITAGVDFRDSITNTGFGVDALLNVSTGGYNTAYGYNALKSITESEGNVAIGYSAMGDCLLDNLSYSNIAIGYNALNSILGAYQSVVAIGTDAMNDITTNLTNSRTIAIGTNALRGIFFANDGVAIGTNAVRNGSISNGIAIGKDVAYSENGVGIVRSSLIGNSIGAGGQTSFNNSVAIGNEIAYLSQGLSDTIAIGYQAMYQNTASNSDIAIGYQAMFSTNYPAAEGVPTQTANNLAIGYRALYNIYSETEVADSSQNIAIGYEAVYGTDGIVMNNIIGIGYQAAKTPLPFDDLLANGFYPIAIGANAGTNAPTSTIFIGSEAGFAATGTQNIGVGYRALNVATGMFNTALGSNALLSCTTANNNTAIGADALEFLTTSLDNTAVGYNALNLVSTGAGLNVGVGSNVATALTTGTRNVYVGASATASSTSDSNVVIGQGAIGTGSNNTLVGQLASTGGFSGSIILGKGATATANNQFVVGSTGTPVGTLATEAVVSDRSWSVIINGTTYKVLLKA